MGNSKNENETYAQFRERIFGEPYMVWHDGAYPGTLSNVDDKERGYVAKMLTMGVLEDRDHVAVDAWGDFDPEAGLKLLKPLIGKYQDAQFVAALTRFLQKYDNGASDEENEAVEDAFVSSLNNAGSFGSIDTVMTAKDFPSKKVIQALLDNVANSPEYLIRYHAANSLLKIARKKREIGSYNRLFKLIISRVVDSKEMENTPDDFERYKKAARVLKRMITLRWPMIRLASAIGKIKSKSGK